MGGPRGGTQGGGPLAGRRRGTRKAGPCFPLGQLRQAQLESPLARFLWRTRDSRSGEVWDL